MIKNISLISRFTAQSVPCAEIRVLAQSDAGKSISNTSENDLGLPNDNDIALILNRLKIDLKKLGLSESDFAKRLISSA